MSRANAGTSDADTLLPGVASTSKVLFPRGVVISTTLPTVTAVAGFAFAEDTVTWPDRQACLACCRVLYTRVHHSQKSTRERDMPGSLTQPLFQVTGSLGG